MNIAPWRSPLARALHRNRALPNSHYVQLATVRPNGAPANRTLVFRGFLNKQDALQFVTDRRSEKFEQIHSQALGEVCWYFPKTREQFRLLGALTLISSDTPDPLLQTVRQTLWHSLSNNARLQFAWPHPGQDRAEVESFQPSPPNPIDPLPNFCVLLLKTIQVDHLELRGQPQNRWLYQLDQTEKWTQREINP